MIEFISDFYYQDAECLAHEFLKKIYGYAGFKGYLNLIFKV